MFTESTQLLLAIIIIATLSVLLIFVSVLLITTRIHFKRLADKLDSITLSLFFTSKKLESDSDMNKTSFTEIKKALTIINKNIGSLSSGNEALEKKLDEVIKRKNLLKDYRLPTPEESEAMRKTILENINMEVLLSKNLKIARKDSTRNVIDNTMATYPDIEPEYVIKLSLAMIENFLETV